MVLPRGMECRGGKVPFRCGNAADGVRDPQRCDAAGYLGSGGPADARAVAGDEDVRDGGLAPRIGDRIPAALGAVPGVRATGRSAYLHRRDHAVVQE